MRKMYQLVLGVSALALCVSASVGAQEALLGDRGAAEMRQEGIPSVTDLPASVTAVIDENISPRDRAMWRGELERELELEQEDAMGGDSGAALTAEEVRERERQALVGARALEAGAFRLRMQNSE